MYIQHRFFNTIKFQMTSRMIFIRLRINNSLVMVLFVFFPYCGSIYCIFYHESSTFPSTILQSWEIFSFLLSFYLIFLSIRVLFSYFFSFWSLLPFWQRIKKTFTIKTGKQVFLKIKSILKQSFSMELFAWQLFIKFQFFCFFDYLPHQLIIVFQFDKPNTLTYLPTKELDILGIWVAEIRV